MKLIFIDETSDTNHPNYLGVCGALIDSTKYGKIKREFHEYMRDFHWDPSVEFKGSWIFSSSRGCQAVPVEKRINLTKNIIAMNSSTTNAAIKFCYIHTDVGSQKEQYLSVLKLVVDSLLPRAGTTANGKDVVAIFCDKRSDVCSKEIREILQQTFDRKQLTLLEDVHTIQSNMQTVGICYADIVGYLMSRIDNIQVDQSLFEGLNNAEAQKNVQLRKVITSTSIIQSIKSMQVYKAIRKAN